MPCLRALFSILLVSFANRTLAGCGEHGDPNGLRVFLPDQGEPLSARPIEDLGTEYTGNHFVNLLAKRT